MCLIILINKQYIIYKKFNRCGVETMLEFEKALNMIEKFTIQSIDKIEVELPDSLNLVIADDIYSNADNPPFDNSAMDGYAVIHSDTKGADKNEPVEILVIDRIFAGEYSNNKVVSGKAIKIMTGAPIPDGADSVIKIEDVLAVGDKISIAKEVSLGQNIRKAGEDISIGQLVIKNGTIVTPFEIGILSAIGKAKVKVYKKPCIAFFVTGDELVSVDECPKKGQIRNINTNLICSQLKNSNIDFIDLGIAKDTKEDVERMFNDALKYDGVLITGGASVGDRDFVGDIVFHNSTKLFFNKVAVKPGKPITFGVYKNKPIFALPGNPVSAAIQFEIFARPVFLKMMGVKANKRVKLKAIALNNYYKKNDGRVHIISVTLRNKDGHYYAEFNENIGSAKIASTVAINGIIILGEKETGIKTGETVEVQMINNLLGVV